MYLRHGQSNVAGQSPHKASSLDSEFTLQVEALRTPLAFPSHLLREYEAVHGQQKSPVRPRGYYLRLHFVGNYVFGDGKI